MVTPITGHSGNKYLRRIYPAVGTAQPIDVDVYCVLEAFVVTDAPVAHAIKKLLCAGLRGKGDKIKDLKEAIDALSRAVEMQLRKDAIPKPNEP